MLLGYQGWPYELKQNYLVSQASDNAALCPYIQCSVCFDEQKTKYLKTLLDSEEYPDLLVSVSPPLWGMIPS